MWPYQFKSQKGHTATDAAFNLTMLHEYLHITWTDAIEFNHNATACYDWIVPNMSNLIAQRAGLDPKISSIQGQVLNQAAYHLKTEQGISAGSYCHTTDTPVFGSGQGATNSPTTWAFISSVLFGVYHKQAQGILLQFPDGSTEKFCIQGFVDDLGALTASPEPTLLFKMGQKDAQLWANLLYAASGKLKLAKTLYFILRWGFAQNGTPFILPRDKSEQIIITDPATGQDITLECASNNLGRQYLGTYTTPGLTKKKQIELTTALAKTIANRIRASDLDPANITKAYFSIYFPAVVYPLGSNPIPTSACNKIDAGVSTAFTTF